jgi:DNA-binding protein HU-beta
VSLAGFGKFKVKAPPEREGRNPVNGEKIQDRRVDEAFLFARKAAKDSLNA